MPGVDDHHRALVPLWRRRRFRRTAASFILDRLILAAIGDPFNCAVVLSRTSRRPGSLLFS
jgi:hypothetical protein